MSKKTKILIEPAAFIHIIQTDKPIYKPGQTGKCHMWWWCVITPTTSTRRIFQVLAGRIVATAVILFIQPTLPSLHCLSIQLHLHNFRLHYNICIMLSHNFRNYVYIQDTEDSWFLKSSWQKSYSLKYIFLKNIHQITVKSPLHGVKCRFSLKGPFNPKSTFFVLPAS